MWNLFFYLFLSSRRAFLSNEFSRSAGQSKIYRKGWNARTINDWIKFRNYHANFISFDGGLQRHLFNRQNNTNYYLLDLEHYNYGLYSHYRFYKTSVRPSSTTEDPVREEPGEECVEARSTCIIKKLIELITFLSLRRRCCQCSKNWNIFAIILPTNHTSYSNSKVSLPFQLWAITLTIFLFPWLLRSTMMTMISTIIVSSVRSFGQFDHSSPVQVEQRLWEMLHGNLSVKYRPIHLDDENGFDESFWCPVERQSIYGGLQTNHLFYAKILNEK